MTPHDFSGSLPPARPGWALLTGMALALSLPGSLTAQSPVPDPVTTSPAAAPAPSPAVSPPEPTPAAPPVPGGAAAATPLPGVPLDATPAAVEKIYGPVVKHNARVSRHVVLEGSASMDGDLYGKDGLIIRALFQKGRCALLEYVRAGGVLTAADVKSALAINAGPFSWETGKTSTETSKFYRRSDGRAIAHWTTEYDGSLLVATEDADTGFPKDLLH